MRMSTSEEEAVQAYPAVRFATVQRWIKRTGTISWVATAVTFVVVLIIMSQVTPESGMTGFVVAFVAAFVARIGTFLLIPYLGMPALRCPYCSGRVPLVVLPINVKTGALFVNVCPNCSRDLPTTVS
jgi:uncharacterized membrane protein YkgB